MSQSENGDAIRPLHVFIVEDDPEMQKTYRLHLETAGHTVSAAFGMRNAFHRLAARRYDVLIVDIGLPDGDGWEMMRNVRLAHPLFAIAVTARNSEADREESRSVGFRYHLAKPLRLRELDDALREAADETALWS